MKNLRRLIKETEEYHNVGALDNQCADNHPHAPYYLRNSYNHETGKFICTRYPPGPNQNQQTNDALQQWINDALMTPPPTAMMILDLPTPDFDDAWYDEWEGDYGHHPGHGITPDKTIPGKTPNVMGKKQPIKGKNLNEEIKRIKRLF